MVLFKYAHHRHSWLRITMHYGCLLIFLIGLSWSQVCSAADDQPLTYLNQLSPLETVPVLQLKPVDIEVELQKDDQANKSKPGPLRFAVAEEVNVNPDYYGKWEVGPRGTKVWRLRVSSPNATDLNFGFTKYWLPEGAKLYVFSEDEQYIRGPYTHKDNYFHGELWTPVIPGDKGVFELHIPVSYLNDFELVLTRVGCGYRDLFELYGAGKQGTCNIDVICPEGDPWRDQIQSVAVFQIGSTWTCTGAMINNTSNDLTPYFLTADHCGVSTSNDTSVVAYFNFHSPNCGDLSGGSLSDVTTGGTTFRSDYSTSDFTLLEFVNDPPSAWNVYWSGWDRTDTAPPSAVTIHHPSTDEKAISFEDDPVNIATYLGTSPPGDGTHLWIDDWDVRPSNEGTTEPGSSGSPLYNPTQRIIGQLHGGYAACGNDDSDWYGRLYTSWTGGGTNATRLSNWLDPTSTGDTGIDGTFQCTMPGTPSSLSASAGGDNQINLSWSNGSPASNTFNVYRAIGSCPQASYTLIASAVSGTTYNDTTVSGTITYAYVITGMDVTENCETPYSNCDDASTSGACTEPPTFAGLQSVTNPGSAVCTLDLSWSAGTAYCGGPVVYNIYRSTTPGFTPSGANLIASGVSSTIYSDSGSLTSGTRYYYIVRAEDDTSHVEEGNLNELSEVPYGPGGGPTNFLDEDFSGGIPGTWSIVDGGTGGGAAATWTTANPGSRSASAPISDPFAIVDSDEAGTSATQDEQLITPTLDLSGAATVTLEFDHYFYYYSSGGNEFGDVDVRSTLTSNSWVNVFRNNGASSPNPDHQSLDITAQAAGAANVQIRFYYYNGDYDWYWMVDNVLVDGFIANPCSSGPAGIPPIGDNSTAGGNAATFDKSGTNVVSSWDTSTCSDSDTIVVYGALTDFTTYTGSAVCTDAGGDGTETFAQPGGNVWFNILWINGATAGHPGYDSGGSARSLQVSTGGYCSISADDTSDGLCD